MPDFFTSSCEQTQALGEKIGNGLKSGQILALDGTLGAGKTTLVQGVAKGLGIVDLVTSPSFIIINEYFGRIPLFHLDLYRLNDQAEIEDLGLENYFVRVGVVVVEWAEKMQSLMPQNAFRITLENLGDDKRKICLPSELAAQLKL